MMATKLHIGLPLSQIYFPLRNMVLCEVSIVPCGIDLVLTEFYALYKANTDLMHLRKVRRFNNYYPLPGIFKEHIKLVGVLRRTDGRYCECTGFADRTLEPALTSDAMVLQAIRYANERIQTVNHILLDWPPDFTPHIHVYVTQGGREIANFPDCARDDTTSAD
ncbi:hypothetical protein HO173_004984 [Letharia columbiana]|uniref:Uncharacterized protein n=1 Tax=Letharia columbiana TaxID=112416 RepID=A0A8H6L5S5_9LECA|nr:uncharacterized protein HO173_004984 [Letharia columbiana]KAF6236693.1 hypothetical protein HO173_004984 [Letharia columbiana]